MGVENPEKPKLYIRLPVKIKDEEQIKALHSNIVQVVLPRQKSRRWCFVIFASKEKLEEARGVLKELRVNNKKIVVKGDKVARKRSGTTSNESPVGLLDTK